MLYFRFRAIKKLCDTCILKIRCIFSTMIDIRGNILTQDMKENKLLAIAVRKGLLQEW